MDIYKTYSAYIKLTEAEQKAEKLDIELDYSTQEIDWRPCGFLMEDVKYAEMVIADNALGCTRIHCYDGTNRVIKSKYKQFIEDWEEYRRKTTWHETE